MAVFGMYNNCAVSGAEGDNPANWKAVRDAYMGPTVKWRREFNSSLPATYKGGDGPYGISTFLSFKSPYADVVSGASETAIKAYANTWPTGCYATWEHEPESPKKEFVSDPHNHFVLPFQTIYGWVKAVRPDVHFGPVHLAYQWMNGGSADPGVSAGNASRWVVNPSFADFYGVDWYNFGFNAAGWNLATATDFQNFWSVISPQAKPIWLSEYGIAASSSSDGGKSDAQTATIISASHTWASTHSQLAGVLYWNGINSDGGTHDIQITPSTSDHTGRPTALAAWNSWAGTAPATAGATVAFTDRSTAGPSGPIVSRAWDFGDSGTSALTNPSHTYAAAGTYTVGLTVTGTGGDGTASATQSVNVTDATAIRAKFSVVDSGLAATFTDLSTPGPSGPITGWAWNFGDSNTSSSQNPTHTYASAGTYTVTLTVTGTSPDGTASATQSVTPVAGGGGTGPSGIAVPSTSPSGFSLHFADGFDTDCTLGDFPIYGVVNGSTPAAVAAKWTSYPDAYGVTRNKQDGSPGFYRSERTVSIAGSVMSINMHYDGGIGQYCCAAPIPRLFPAQTAKWQMSSSLYGRYEVCLRQTAPSGTYKIAWLLWPDAGDNYVGGEIDCPEVDLNESFNVLGFMHNAGSVGGQVSANMGVKLSGWHTYAIEWAPGSVKFFTDGTLKGQGTSNVPLNPMHWILQSELLLGTQPLSHSDSVTLECDWVAFWTKT